MEGEGATPSPQISVTRVSVVAPALPLETHRMFLSNLDLLWLPFTMRKVLFYRISTEDDYSYIVERFKKSLSSVLVHYYPLAGRLVDGESGRVEVDCNNEGVEFIEASANVRFEELEEEGFQHKPYFTKLASTIKPLEKGNYSAPILSVQVTSFKGGSGICLGTTYHHVIMDGRSYWHFMKSWGECSRGLLVSDPPVHNRRVFKIENKSRLPLSFTPHAISNDRMTDAHILKFVPDASQAGREKIMSTLAEGDTRKESMAKWQHQNNPLIYSTFHFADAVIQKLKQRTGASTSFIAVAAQFWRSIVKSREVPEQEFVYFALMADCRARVTPPLPPTYFGNCISLGIARTTAKKLLTEDVSFAAQLIKEAISCCTEEEQIENMIQWLESPRNNIFAIIEELARGCCTNVSGSMRFPVYEVDYGWGKPLNTQLASMNGIGSMGLAGRSAEFGVPVSTCLPSNMMHKLRQIIFD